jgi:hypothetical protein
MTELLERAVAQVKQLPANEQDAIAAIILEELEDEVRWQEKFACSQDILAKLAAEAMAEDQAGKTQELDVDNL